MKAEDDGAVRSVLRAFDLLALFTERHRTWAVKDLTAASGLAPGDRITRAMRLFRLN